MSETFMLVAVFNHPCEIKNSTAILQSFTRRKAIGFPIIIVNVAFDEQDILQQDESFFFYF